MDIYPSNRATRAQIFHFFHISDWMGVVIVERSMCCGLHSPAIWVIRPTGWLLVVVRQAGVQWVHHFMGVG